MTKWVIDLEDRLLELARRALGTGTVEETVTMALSLVVENHDLRIRVNDAVLQTFAAATTDLADDEVMATAWA